MISTLFFMQSCSTEEESTATATTASQTMTDSTGASVSLDGTYLQACAASGSAYVKLEIVLSGTTNTFTQDSFSDDTCATSKNDLAVTKIDNALQSISLTVLSDQWAAMFNSSSLFGFTDWANGTAKSVLGLNSDGTTDSTSSVGVVSYDILYINGTSLQSGGGSSSTYPTELDYSSVYTKQ